MITAGDKEHVYLPYGLFSEDFQEARSDLKKNRSTILMSNMTESTVWFDFVQ